jgi:hypothetical protein
MYYTKLLHAYDAQAGEYLYIYESARRLAHIFDSTLLSLFCHFGVDCSYSLASDHEEMV